MSWDLRNKFIFDPSESQIAEGLVSPYGIANSHANCIPASFTAALDLIHLVDIDPQLIVNEVFGPNYRGGTGDFTKTIAWIKANVAGAPDFTDGPFDFNVAEQAGMNGQLIVIAGYIDAATVSFIPGPQAWSHASLLVAHLPDDTFVIWNVWTGFFQTYSRATLAASLYEMSVMQPILQEEDMADLVFNPDTKAIYILKEQDITRKRHLSLADWQGYEARGYKLFIPPADMNVSLRLAAIPDVLEGSALNAADAKLLKEAHDQIAALVATGLSLSTIQAQQLQESRDTIVTLAKTGTLTPAQDKNLQEAHDLIVKDLK